MSYKVEWGPSELRRHLRQPPHVDRDADKHALPEMLASLRAAVNSPTFVITPDTERASDGCPSTAESTNLGACEEEGTERTPYQFLGYYLLQGSELPFPPRREVNCKRWSCVRTSRR